jgi:hypothetical protein
MVASAQAVRLENIQMLAIRSRVSDAYKASTKMRQLKGLANFATEVNTAECPGP